MTAIAAVVANGKILMGADSSAIEQGHYLVLAGAPKVFEVGPLVMGYTSSFRMGAALQHRLAIPDGLPEAHDLAGLDRWMNVAFVDAVREAMRACGYMKIDNSREMGGQFLVGVRGQLYFMDDDFHAIRYVTPYGACGSGVSACLAALFISTRIAASYPFPARHQVQHALEAAEACVATVRGPFHIIEGGKA